MTTDPAPIIRALLALVERQEIRQLPLEVA